jgi:DNA-binding beta-propeller fold protein YncE
MSTPLNHSPASSSKKEGSPSKRDTIARAARPRRLLASPRPSHPETLSGDLMLNTRAALRNTLCLGGALLAAAATSQAAAPAGAVAYVSNQNGDVTVLDLATMAPSGTVSAYGKEPRGIGVTSDGKYLVLANREGGSIAVIDRASGKLVRHVAIGANPEFVRTRGHFAFVSYEPESTGEAPPRGPTASGSTSASAPAAPPAPASAEGGKHEEEESHNPARVAVVDLDAGQVLRSFQGGMETEGIEFSADGRHVIVANEADNTLTVHDMETGQVVKTIDVKGYGNRPRGIKRSPDGKSYVATLEFSNLLLVLDGQYNVVRSVKTAEAPYGVAFDRSGERVYVAAARSKLLQVFDTRTWTLVKDVPTGQRCWHFSFTPDDKSILMACGRSSEIVVIDTATLQPAKRIADPQMPWGVVTYPKSPGSLDQVE